MKVAIMQPYFMPYIGYFQLINAVDKFVIYDNVKYTKKGWINRNRMIQNGVAETFSIPLKKDSDYLQISERIISNEFDKEKFIRKIENNYKKAPEFENIFPLIKEIIHFNSNNLFDYILNSIKLINSFLEIQTEIIVSSTIKYNSTLKSEEMVIDICKQLNSEIYINPTGGINLYSYNNFKSEGIELYFLKSNEFIYPQLSSDFIAWLSILDVLMMNSKDEVKQIIKKQFEIKLPYEF